MSAKKNDIFIGQVFGQLTVVEIDYIRVIRQRNIYMSKVRCTCGNYNVVPNHELRSGQQRSCGCVRIQHAKTVNIKHGGRNTSLYKTWASIKDRCKTQLTYTEKGIRLWLGWENDFPAFEKYMLETLGPRPEGMTLDRIDNNKGYEPGNLRWATGEEQNNNRSTSLINRFQDLEQLSKDCGVFVGDRFERLVVVEHLLKEGRYKHYIRVRCDCGKEKTIRTTVWQQKGTTSCGCLKKDNQTKHYLTVNGETKTITEWAKQTGISQPTISQRKRLGWTDTMAVLTPVRKMHKPVADTNSF